MYVASTFRRSVAHVCDEFIGGIFLLPLFVIAWHKLSLGEDVWIGWGWLGIVFSAKVTYEVICLCGLQALPAQYFFGLRVISTQHPELGLGIRQSLVRVLVGQMKYLIGPSMHFMALFHKQRQHLGDILAETRVVQEEQRDFPLKNRYLLGSILVYLSLVVNLGNAVDKFSSQEITSDGFYWSWSGFEE